MQARRNNLRHQEWHYGNAGAYFITICTANRIDLFDSPSYRAIAETAWQKIPTYNSKTKIRLDEWIVMPNHLHGIVWILDGYPAGSPRPQKTLSGSIGAIIGTYKATVANRLNRQRMQPGARVWQRGYYDRIIRTEQELQATQEYIRNNPVRWQENQADLSKLLDKLTRRN